MASNYQTLATDLIAAFRARESQTSQAIFDRNPAAIDNPQWDELLAVLYTITDYCHDPRPQILCVDDVELPFDSTRDDKETHQIKQQVTAEATAFLFAFQQDHTGIDDVWDSVSDIMTIGTDCAWCLSCNTAKDDDTEPDFILFKHPLVDGAPEYRRTIAQFDVSYYPKPAF